MENNNTNLLINLNKAPKTSNTDKTSAKVASSIQDINQAGSLNLSRETILTLKATKKLPENFRGPEFDTALHFHSLGIEAVDVFDKTYRSETLNSDQKTQLYVSGYIMSALEDLDTKQFQMIREVNQYPEIASFQPTAQQQAGPNQTILSGGDNVFSPILREGVGIVRDKLQNYAVGALKKGGQKIAENLIKKGAEKGVQVAVKAGLTAAGVGAEAAVSATGVGAIAVLALEAGKWILGKVKNLFSGALRFFTGEKDFRKQVMLVSGALAAIFLGLGQTIPAAAAGMVSLGAGASMVGGHAIASGAAGVGQALIYGITTVVVPSVVLPVIIAIFVIPIAVALILFIINSGAYVVPWGGFDVAPPAALENLYIDVDKTPEPPGPFPNNQSNTVKYTITITARQGILSNIVFVYECKVFAEYQRECPISPDLKNIKAGPASLEPQSFPSFEAALPTIISPTDPYVITYEIFYSSGRFNNSLVSDTFTVTADSIDAPNQKASGGATITFGTPPTGCFKVVDNAYPWPGSYANNMNSAVVTLIRDHPAFVSKVCSGGDVNLCFDPPAVDAWGWHTHDSKCDIRFDNTSSSGVSGGLSNISNALYILTHESSHHIQYVMGNFQVAYEDLIGRLSELPFCTDKRTNSMPTEAFAEMNALYVQTPSYWCGGTFQSLYPIHYDFANRCVFSAAPDCSP